MQLIESATKGKIGKYPVWAIAIAGAGGLFLVTRLRGGGTNTLQTLPSKDTATDNNSSVFDDSAIRSDIAGYSDATGQQFDTLNADLNARFGDITTALGEQRASDEALYRDFTGGLASQQAELKKTQAMLAANTTRSSADYESLRKLAAASATQAQITALERKVEAVNQNVTTLREQETARDKRMATTVEKINAILAAVSGSTVNRQPVVR